MSPSPTRRSKLLTPVTRFALVPVLALAALTVAAAALASVADERALADAVRAGKLAGAGLDVFEVEPMAADSPLLGLPNVVLTPHVASYSEEGDVAHQKRTAEILLQVVKGGLPERKVVVNKDLYDQLANSLQATPV